MNLLEKASPKKPKFFIDFNCFTTFPSQVDVSIIVSPNWELNVVSDILHDVENARVLSLVFTPVKPKKGRRIFTLKEEVGQKK